MNAKANKMLVFYEKPLRFWTCDEQFADQIEQNLLDLKVPYMLVVDDTDEVNGTFTFEPLNELYAYEFKLAYDLIKTVHGLR